jgi:hypothetical protein
VVLHPAKGCPLRESHHGSPQQSRDPAFSSGFARNVTPNLWGEEQSHQNQACDRSSSQPINLVIGEAPGDYGQRTELLFGKRSLYDQTGACVRKLLHKPLLYFCCGF